MLWSVLCSFAIKKCQTTIVSHEQDVAMTEVLLFQLYIVNE